MAKRRVTIIGTGCIGASIGMALRNSPAAGELEIVGHDRDSGIAHQAERQGAFDRTTLLLDPALKDAGMVIVAVPFSEMETVLSDLGRLLEPDSGVVVTDTAPLKAPVLAWADKLLPPGVHFIGGDPILAPREEVKFPSSVADAGAELLKEALYTITIRPTDAPKAIEGVTNLAQQIGATPLYMDPVEHDGVRLFTRMLPDLTAVALLRTVMGDSGWEEMRKVASHHFAAGTSAAHGEVASRRLMAELGRDSLLRGLDNLVGELQSLRRAIAEGDDESLAATFHSTAEARTVWLHQAQTRDWEEQGAAPEMPGAMQRTLEMFFGRRKKRGE
ncbi:MAG: prephenate dehydrogenase [Anaerolineales bacterium]